jgi:hypothetical protein
MNLPNQMTWLKLLELSNAALTKSLFRLRVKRNISPKPVNVDPSIETIEDISIGTSMSRSAAK